MNIDEEIDKEEDEEDEIADVAIHRIPARPPEQSADEELRCVQCGAPVPDVACGHVMPCRSCGYLYPLGDCSDFAEN
jgi:hypothetical protein